MYQFFVFHVEPDDYVFFAFGGFFVILRVIADALGDFINCFFDKILASRTGNAGIKVGTHVIKEQVREERVVEFAFEFQLFAYDSCAVVHAVFDDRHEFYGVDEIESDDAAFS